MIKGGSSGQVLYDRPYAGAVTPTQLTDRSRYKNNGTWANITPVRLPSGLWVDSYNGAASTITISHNSILTFVEADFTVTMWIYPLNIATEPTIWCKNLINTYGTRLQLRSDGRLDVFTNQAAAQQATRSAAGVITNSRWVFIATPRTGSSIRTYINTVDQTSTVGVHVNPTTNTDNLYLGSYRNASAWFQGYLTLTQTYRRYLNPAEIRSIYMRQRRSFGV